MADKSKLKTASDYAKGGPAVAIDAAHTPIGVAPDFVAPITDAFGNVAGQQKPRYYPGAQNTEIAGLAPEDRAQLQITMKQLGLIGKNTPITLGVWDVTSANAFREVLSWANSTGATWQQALSDMQSSASTFPTNGAATQTKEATNPLDVQALGDQTGLNYLGHSLTADQTSSLQSDFASAEAPYLNSDSTTSAPSSQGWDEWAKTKVRNFDPVNFDAHKVLAGVDVLRKMLGGQ